MDIEQRGFTSSWSAYDMGMPNSCYVSVNGDQPVGIINFKKLEWIESKQ